MMLRMRRDKQVAFYISNIVSLECYCCSRVLLVESIVCIRGEFLLVESRIVLKLSLFVIENMLFVTPSNRILIKSILVSRIQLRLISFELVCRRK